MNHTMRPGKPSMGESQFFCVNVAAPLLDGSSSPGQWLTDSVGDFVRGIFFGLGSFKKMACVFGLILLFVTSLPAQTNQPNSPGRYLFVIETSKSMKPRAAAVRKAVDSLLRSGMNAQLKQGATIGVWTYNEALFAGVLPLQEWSPEREQVVASNVTAFLKIQPFEKEGRIAAVWPALVDLIAESEKLTILLISGGNEPISGTAYDRTINEFFKINGPSQQQKRMPFVTVLRAYHGKLIGGTMNLAPWPVTFPPFPPEPKKTVSKPAPPPKPPAPKAAPSQSPSLIVVRKPAEPEAVVAPSPAPATVAPATEQAPVAAPEVKPVSPATNAAVPPPPVELPPAALPAVVAANDSPPVAPVVPEKAAIVEAPPPATPAPAPAIAAVPAAPVQAPPKPEFKSEPQPEPPVVAGETTHPEPPEPSLAAAPAAIPAAQTATAPHILESAKLWIMIATGVSLFALVVAFILIRRSRSTPEASLITRSMEREKKETSHH